MEAELPLTSVPAVSQLGRHDDVLPAEEPVTTPLLRYEQWCGFLQVLERIQQGRPSGTRDDLATVFDDTIDGARCAEVDVRGGTASGGHGEKNENEGQTRNAHDLTSISV